MTAGAGCKPAGDRLDAQIYIGGSINCRWLPATEATQGERAGLLDPRRPNFRTLAIATDPRLLANHLQMHGFSQRLTLAHFREDSMSVHMAQVAVLLLHSARLVALGLSRNHNER
jgi:hypothetical protein